MAVNILHDEEFDFGEDLLLLPQCTYWEGVLFTVSPKRSDTVVGWLLMMLRFRQVTY